ncbi:MAG: CsbD family protein [Pseudonocardiaceae bacterium]
MGIGDKISNKAEELKGKLKEATGDEHLEAEGKVDQAESKIKQAGEKVKDFFRS